MGDNLYLHEGTYFLEDEPGTQDETMYYRQETFYCTQALSILRFAALDTCCNGKYAFWTRTLYSCMPRYTTQKLGKIQLSYMFQCNHIVRNNVITNNQSGFRPGDSNYYH